MTSSAPFRNPYPVPDVSSEGFWLPPGPVLGDKVEINDIRWKSKVDIHERLFAHHTLNSIRKDQRLVRTEEPSDALDLALTSIYVHSEDTLVPKMYVPMQPEALGRDTWRVLRNELKTSSPHFEIHTGSAPARYTREGGIRERSDQHRPKTGSKMAAERGKMAARATAARAASAPVRSTREAPNGNLHKYAGRTRHDVIPDRIARIHPSSLKLAIVGPHTDQTNAGYSRKQDGTYYGV